mgnify:CR=1 FL=1
MAEDDNFFSRWSRRKQQVRTGEPLPADPPLPAARPEPAPAVRPAAAAAPAAVVPPATTPAAPAQAAPTEDRPPPPSLDDVAQLTPEADFSRFVARDVSPEVRNAAVKKLFADPHFNVMDGLDIYIDDYSKPSPLSPLEMAKMVGAQFLKLVDDPNEPPPAAPAAAQGRMDAPASAPTPSESVAEPGTDTPHPRDHDSVADARDPTASEPPEPPHDDHADLQLQPDHDAQPPGSERRAG